MSHSTPMERSWGQARSQEYLDKILSHGKQKVSNKTPNFNPNYFLPFELYVTLAGVKHAVIIAQSYIGINYFISSFPVWFLMVPSMHTVASVAHLHQERGTLLCLVLKKGFCSCSMDLLLSCCVQFSRLPQWYHPWEDGGRGDPPIQFI